MTECGSAISRRGFLRYAAGGAALLSLPGLLSACGGEAGTESGARTGLLRVAGTAASTADLNPLQGGGGHTGLDYVVATQRFDQLVLLKTGNIELSLAESIEPNADATQWTIRVRDGVTFHDGKPLTAQDVVYSLRLLGDPQRNQNAALLRDLDLPELRVVDDRTVQVPLTRARGDFVDGILSLQSLVFPTGLSDFSTAVGSGPFKLASYRSGAPAEMTRNEDYWAGAPSIGELEIRGIDDPAARLNAVRGGQIDYALAITAVGAVSTERGDDVTIVRSGAGSALMFAMNVTLPPFDNPAVREAFRLAIDRQALIDSVLFGQGVLGNDVPGKGLPGYNDALPQRSRDVDRARRLLADAGVTNVAMRAADLQPGLVDAAGLYARQLDEVGVEVTIDEAPADSYFNDYERILSTPFQAFYAENRPAAVNIVTFNGSQADFNITGFGDREFDAKIAEAQATVDDTRRTERFKEVQRILYERGGEIVWAFSEQLDAARNGVEGVQQTQGVPLFAKARLT